MKSYLSKSKVVILALIAIIGTTLAASALTAKLNDNTNKEGISYLGVQDNLSVYRLALKNKTSETYFVSISNIAGDVIFCDEVSGIAIVRNYQFDNKIYNTADNLTFTVSDLKGKTVATYKVDRAQKTAYTIDTTNGK
ncbi:MAG TPA: hypothetical protein VL943_06590 [Niabella sp.]|nr:hypothetical protein [Niabella sp.]